jgi:hypothetical protein
VEQGERKRKGRGGKEKQPSTSDWAPLTLRRHSRDWFRELSGSARARGARQSEKDDAFLRQLLTLYVVSGQSEQSTTSEPVLSLETLDLPEQTRELFRQAMAVSGSTDLLTFLLAQAEPQAQRLVQQEGQHDARIYETLSTETLKAKRTEPGARQELYRRAVYSVMTYNEAHTLTERWYLSDRAIQSLAGGKKEFIKLYKEAHAEEIADHHRALSIEEGFNRKPGRPQIQDVVKIPKEATAFPWGSHLSAGTTDSD